MLSNIIKNGRVDYKPIWFMRQAGRHLKDYRKLRLKHTNFIQFCLDEDSIIEATLIPMKHYDLDAAIIFSDILIIPWLLEQKIEFIKNFGPKLTPLVEWPKQKRLELQHFFYAAQPQAM